MAIGKTKVIRNTEDLFKFKTVEILVFDAIEPNMTFVVPMASGIVERRGGMLIHGTIIVRGIRPALCYRVSDATALIKNEQEIVVDGYLGIITFNRYKPIN